MHSLEDWNDEVRRWNDEEHRLLNLMTEYARGSDFTTEEETLSRAARLETMRRELRQSKARVAALVAGVAGDA